MSLKDMSRQEKLGLWLGILASLSVIYEVWVKPYVDKSPHAEPANVGIPLMLLLASVLSAVSIVLWVFSSRRSIRPGVSVQASVPAGTSPTPIPTLSHALRPLPPPPDRPNAPPPRVYTDATLAYIGECYKKGNTTIQSKQLVQDFMGKWKTVCGKFKDTEDWIVGGVQVHLTSTDPSGTHLAAKFAEAWRDRLSDIMPGAEVTLTGEIDWIGDSYVGLKNCELL